MQTKMIKDGQVINNDWQLIVSEEGVIPASNSIVPLAAWLGQPELKERGNVGVWLKNDVDLNEIAENLIEAPVIAIDFPVFMDGRGFSIARLLRERFNYTGEIRAVGHIIRDQLCYLKRCGFNAFTFNDDSVDINAAVTSLNDFTEAYQTSVDTPTPLFRRRTSA